MKIDTITITNYKAFYGTHQFKIDGKNCLIYGENGSGKSSFYYALKDFFKAATLEAEDAATHKNFLSREVRNLYATKYSKDPGRVHVSFLDVAGSKGYEWSMLSQNMEQEEPKALIGRWAKRRPPVFRIAVTRFRLRKKFLLGFFVDRSFSGGYQFPSLSPAGWF